MTPPPDWPHVDCSRMVEAAGIRWHVQEMGAGPVLLLVHGTAASTHSWRHLAPLLAQHMRVVSVDLPGHGWTAEVAASALTLPGIADLLARLLDSMRCEARLVAGHSAGAAVLARMLLDGRLQASGLVSINGAWKPFGGMAERLCGGLAGVLACSPAARIIARQAGRPHRVRRLIRNTGSTIDARGIALYARLLGCPRHVQTVFSMMSRWSLGQLRRELGNLRTPTLLIGSSADRAVPAAHAGCIASRLPCGRSLCLQGGHLVHEEDPASVAAAMLEFAGTLGIVNEPAGT